VLDAALGLFALTRLNDFNGPAAREYAPADLAAVDPSCRLDLPIVAKRNGAGEFPSDLNSLPGWVGGADPDYKDADGVSDLPESYPRLKEGVERFAITDINNPAGAAQAQSTLFVMWDAYAAANSGLSRSDFTDARGNSVLQFNHVPSGSNVLYMDGHVEYVRLESKPPMLTESLNPNSMAGALFPGAFEGNWWTGDLGVFGGMG
jgi:prepilin-type processing-associated H-X9-DG protein